MLKASLLDFARTSKGQLFSEVIVSPNIGTKNCQDFYLV
jgi:hypothetical protein